MRLDEAQLNTVGYVVSRYGALTGVDLMNLTHAEQPWLLADSKRRPGERTRIELAWMRDYFRSVPADEDDELMLDSEAVTHWLNGAAGRAQEPIRPDSEAEIRARLGA